MVIWIWFERLLPPIFEIQAGSQSSFAPACYLKPNQPDSYSFLFRKVARSYCTCAMLTSALQLILNLDGKQCIYRTWLVQLNKYETAPYFLQLSQNMTSDCFFTFVFSPQIYLSCTKNCFILMFRTIFWATQVNSRENTWVNKQSLVMFRLNWRKYGSVSHSLSCSNVLHLLDLY